MKSNLKVFLKGILDVSPLMIPVVPFGLIFGVLAIDVGFSPLETMGMYKYWYFGITWCFKGINKVSPPKFPIYHL